MLTRRSTSALGVVLEPADAHALGHFYADLLGWEVQREQDGWLTLAADGHAALLSFTTSPDDLPPVWPTVPGQQQMMAQPDLAVADLAAAVEVAVAAGATLADAEPQDDVRVMLDPAGHPFCLYVPE